MQQINDFVVAGLGIATVFVALICIIFICNVLGGIFKRLDDKRSESVKGESADAGTVSHAPSVQAPVQTQPAVTGLTVPRGSYVSAKLENRGAFIAAVSAVIAEDLGTDVSHIRILSVKQRADAIKNRGELCAAISAVIAEDTGAEGVRIHSIRRVENRGELCAAISAVISLDTGADAVRIHSIRRV